MFKNAAFILVFSTMLLGCGTDNPLDRGPDLPGGQVETPTGPVSFAADVKPILQVCASCHSGGAGGWVYTGGVESHASVLEVISVSSPDESALLVKGTGGDGHGGGSFFNNGGASYQTIVNWISQGAENN